MPRSSGDVDVPGYGDVVLVRDLLDPNGVNPKTRPCVVVTSDEDLQACRPIIVAAISTLLPGPVPDDVVVLPYHPQGRVRTGLKTRCAAIARWLVATEVARIERVLGRVPGKEMMQLAAILKRIESEGDDPSD